LGNWPSMVFLLALLKDKHSLTHIYTGSWW
jgi:hypothetical protein